MFECYFDIRGAGARPARRIACSTAYLAQQDGRSAFARRWNHLLIKHELRHLELGDWRKTAAHHGWDGGRQSAILQEFVDATVSHDLLGMIVAIDPSVWKTIEPRTRNSFGSQQDFCFQRLTRLIRDRVETSHNTAPVSIILERDIDRFHELSTAVKRVFWADSRAGSRISAVQFVDARHNAYLQASHLLTHLAMNHLAHHSDGGVALPAWLRDLKGLPALPDGVTCEYWDQAYSSRHQASLHWMTPDKPDRKKH